ncbi:adenylate/guanylate cyclase domain-containing protein [Microvirga massiliensis]|uniref:adenylate/guanylate cyclase domain-containing protein n=1 Tax=Microvirga massiliensis TaxID=1033741 RepID=UPI00062B9631|nr:adenylate/guanylate cyclase domain-containing protein [Microvirga massiliensis]
MSPQDHRIERRLVAIFAADVAGYSRLVELDEVGTLRTLAAHREVMDRFIAQHRGRIANTAGDSVLAEFPSPVDAVQCAVRTQAALRTRNDTLPQERRVSFRIAVHVGDVVVNYGDLLGDAVNIAARLQALAEPGRVRLSETAQRHVRKLLHLALDDLGPQVVKNIEEPIHAFVIQPIEGSTSLPHGSLQNLALPDKPSIAVLPFTNMSRDPEQEYFADGMTEEIIAALSRVRSFFVIARSSTFTYKGKAVDVRQVSRELGVRYVLEGSLRTAGNRLRIIAQLVDATDGRHVWADRYEGELADIFDLQDRVTEALVGAIEPTITLSEIERIRRKRPDRLDAYECAMRALPAVWSQDRESTSEGLRLAEQAMALDPAYALPKALAAWCHAQRVTYLRTADPAEDRAAALRLAREAASLDSNDPLVLTVLSAAYALVGQIDLGLTTVRNALALDPNSAWAWLRSGWLHAYAQHPDTAIEHFDRAMRLSPLDPMHFNALVGIGAAHFDKGQYDESARWIEQALRERPDATWTYRPLAAAYAQAGRLEEAKQTMARFLQAYPGMTVSRAVAAVPYGGSMGERIAEGLRRAGLPE